MSQIKIGARLKELRESKGVSQGEVERMIKIPRKNLSSYENDHSIPPLEVLLKMAKYYDSDLNCIIFGDKNMQRKEIKYSKIVEYIDEINNFDNEEMKLFKEIIERMIYINKNKKNFKKSKNIS